VTVTKMIAGLIGPTLIAMAVAVLLNLSSIPALVEEVSHEPGLIMMSGILLFVAGVSIVRAHNRWTGGWPIVVTVLGWLFVLGGLARLLFPVRITGIAVGLGSNMSVIAGAEAVILLLVGAFLSFMAYRRD
jgi:hypothetical protein